MREPAHARGSNHLLAPTGLLFKTGLLGAETLTVVKTTTSQHVLDYYPGDCTEELKPAENRARAFASVGMRPFFNYALKRVIKCSYTKNTWRPFDVPAIELRRILGEMSAAGKAATLTYKDGDRTIQVGYDADGAQVKCGLHAGRRRVAGPAALLGREVPGVFTVPRARRRQRRDALRRALTLTQSRYNRP